MNRGKGQIFSSLGGYTIVETLIFLAVSGLMFFSTMLLIGGQQNKTQFVSAVRDFETQLKDVANNVSTGYYDRPTNLSCTINGAYPDPQVGGDTIGSSGNCMFVGVVVKLGNGPDGELEKYSTIPMAGLRLAAGLNKDVKDLSQARPTVVSPSVETKSFQYGTRVGGMSVNGGPFTNAAIGFFAKLRGTDDVTQGGTLQTDVLTYNAISPDQDVASTTTSINAETFGYDTSTMAGIMNPNGVTICLLSGGTDQHALIKLGGNGGRLTIISEIHQGGSCS